MQEYCRTKRYKMSTTVAYAFDLAEKLLGGVNADGWTATMVYSNNRTEALEALLEAAQDGNDATKTQQHMKVQDSEKDDACDTIGKVTKSYDTS